MKHKIINGWTRAKMIERVKKYVPEEGCSRHGGYSRAYVWDEWEEREAERPAETG